MKNKTQRRVDTDPVNRSSRRSINKTEAVPLGHCKVLGEMFVNVLSALRALARWPPLRLARPEICGFAMLFRQWPAWQGPEAWNRPFFSHGPQRKLESALLQIQT